MSGPLASWVSEHSRASYRGRAVLLQLALRARHDGMPTSDVTRAQLEHRTGMSLTNVRYGLAEVRRLGEVRVVEQGGGRGRPTRYVPAPPCPAEAECWDCRVLADTIAKTGRNVPGFESVNDKGNRARERGNRARDGLNRAHPAHTHGTGDGTPSTTGGTVTRPESERPRSRRPSADAAAASARVREQPIGPATGAAAARGLALLAEIRKLDRDAEFNPAIGGFRISDAWQKRYGGFSGIPLDKAEQWVAWAAKQVADEQAGMQAASRHRLADPVPVAAVLDEFGQERGAVS